MRRNLASLACVILVVAWMAGPPQPSLKDSILIEDLALGTTTSEILKEWSPLPEVRQDEENMLLVRKGHPEAGFDVMALAGRAYQIEGGRLTIGSKAICVGASATEVHAKLGPPASTYQVPSEYRPGIDHDSEKYLERDSHGVPVVAVFVDYGADKARKFTLVDWERAPEFQTYARARGIPEIP